MSTYKYSKSPVNLDTLTVEVQQSGILTVLDYMYSQEPDLEIYFDSDLNQEEKDLLDAVVANHQGLPTS